MTLLLYTTLQEKFTLINLLIILTKVAMDGSLACKCTSRNVQAAGGNTALTNAVQQVSA